MWAVGAAAALERGYNALQFYGPGQGEMLFQRQIPFPPDWEHVITPVVDYLHSRRDVDSGRIALIGNTLGGELVIRAAAFEHRLAAVAADPGFLDLWLTWNGGFEVAKASEGYGHQFLQAARAGQVFTDMYDFATTVMKFTVADVASHVTAPALVTEYEDDILSPRRST
jgi:cephalosporin-C deacetylase-like acetyl esterase